MAKRSDWISDGLRAIALLLLAAGALGIWINLNDRDRTFSERGHILPPRFQTDNAVGATANATEWIAKQTSPPLIGDAIWLGLALIALASLRRTRIAIERLADELAPLPTEEPPTAKPSLARHVGNAVGNAMASVVAPTFLVGDKEQPDVQPPVPPIKKKKPPPTPPNSSAVDDANWPKL